MQHRFNDLIIVSTLAVICAVLALMTAAIPLLRVLSALPLVLILPGYAVMMACFPRRFWGPVEQAGISLGLSVAIVILLGLALYWMNILLVTATWAIGLAAITLVACGIAWRRRPVAARQGFEVNLAINLGLRDLVLLGLAIAVVAVALSIARLPSPPGTVSGYTSLWLVPANADNNADYQVGITSQEFVPLTYHLQVTANGQIVKDWPELRLAPGGTWTSSITLSGEQVITGTVEATLYRLDNPTAVYRQVWLQPNG